MKEYELSGPLTKEALAPLRAGDRVYYSGTLYTARDAAHKRITEALAAGEQPPFPISGSVIYYCGPSPAGPGAVIGSAGPTTSYRMDAYAPALLDLGLLAMIGKGGRSREVTDAVVRSGAVYFAAVGGAAALLAHCVRVCRIVCYEELGAEAVRLLTVERLPLTVATDSLGGDIYTLGPEGYRAFTESKESEGHT